MLQLHHHRTTAPTNTTILVDRLDRLPGGRAVTLLTAEGQLILPFDKNELTEAGATELQALLRRMVDEGVIQICQSPAPAEPWQRHAS